MSVHGYKHLDHGSLRDLGNSVWQFKTHRNEDVNLLGAIGDAVRIIRSAPSLCQEVRFSLGAFRDVRVHKGKTSQEVYDRITSKFSHAA